MAIETRDKEINGSIYTVTQLPARRALRLKAKLIKVFGPVLAQFFVTVSDSKDDESTQKNNIVKAVEMLGEHLDPNEFENLVVELLQGVRKGGMELTPAIIDLEFAGDMSSLYQVLWFVIEVNFSNFFELMGIGNKFQQYPEMPQASSTKRGYTRK